MLSKVERVFHEPRLIKKGAQQLKSKLSWRLKSKLPHPKRFFLSVTRKNISPNPLVDPKRLLVFTIFEKDGHLADFKKIFLDKLLGCVQQSLIVVNGQLDPKEIEDLKKRSKVILRPNIDYDVGAFKAALMEIGESQLINFDELLLINDTNIGPFCELASLFTKMSSRRLDFWGIAYGEQQLDFTGFNPFGYIPKHLQSYFLAVDKNLFMRPEFWKYWRDLPKTDTREKAIGLHETYFTEYFSRLGFKHAAVVSDNTDSTMYLHPLKAIREGSPIIKYKALANYDDTRIAWQGLNRHSEIPDLMSFLENNSNYPINVLQKIIADFKNRNYSKYILLIDGVENVIPQLTRYRVANKAEQLTNLGFEVKVVNLSQLSLDMGEFASHIIVYRAPINFQLIQLQKLAKSNHKPMLYDIDDLVMDVRYTNELAYTKGLSTYEKKRYDEGVKSYGAMLKICDAAIASTTVMKEELSTFQPKVLLNRNLINQEIISLSNAAVSAPKSTSRHIKMGYFSGSITHNENFSLIQAALVKILTEFPLAELHLVGYLDLPRELQRFSSQIVVHNFVPWQELPALIAAVDINLAPLVDSLFNRAKSEIKWLEAALVNVPTIASDIGAFSEMIADKKTGVLVKDDGWYEALAWLISDDALRKSIGNNAKFYILEKCTTKNHVDDLVAYLKEGGQK